MAHESLLHYYRCGRLLRLELRGLSQLELREVLVGLWARLGDDEREAHMQDLLYFHSDPESFLTQRASAVARAVADDQTLLLDRISPMFHGELPHAELPGVR